MASILLHGGVVTTEEGDELLVTVDNKRLVLETEEALLERLYQAVGESSADELVSEELLRERREEAQREANRP